MHLSNVMIPMNIQNADGFQSMFTMLFGGLTSFCSGSNRLNTGCQFIIDGDIFRHMSIDGENGMHTVTVSPRFQVVIPKAIRQALHLRPGQKMQIEEYEGRIVLIPERDITELRGFLKGINTEFEREKDRLGLNHERKNQR